MKKSSYVVEVKDNNFFFKSDSHKAMFKHWLEEWNGQKVRIELSKVTSQRSDRQNRALHLWFKMVAEALNDGGYNVQEVVKHKMEIDWNPMLVKELLWRLAQEPITGKKSTVDLRKTGEIDDVYEHINRHLSNIFGLHVPFPSNYEE